MKISTLFALFFAMTIVVLAQPCMAGVIDSAEKSIQSGNRNNLERSIFQLQGYLGKHPKSAKAHMALARVFMKLRRDVQAKPHFRASVQNGGSPAKVQAEYRKAFLSVVNTTKPNYTAAFRFIGNMAEFSNAAHPFDATSEYIKLGSHCARNQYHGMAVKCFAKAKKSDLTEDQRQNIGNGYLWLAAMGFQPENMKKLALPLVGEAKIKQVWPGNQTKEIFTGVYDDSHIDPNTGNIEIYYRRPVRKGDVFEVVATVKGQSTYNADEVYIWRGKNLDPQWYTTKNGKFSYPIEVNMKNGGQTIWIVKDMNIQVRVRVLRTTKSKPNLSLISIPD